MFEMFKERKFLVFFCLLIGVIIFFKMVIGISWLQCVVMFFLFFVVYYYDFKKYNVELRKFNKVSK